MGFFNRNNNSKKKEISPTNTAGYAVVGGVIFLIVLFLLYTSGKEKGTLSENTGMMIFYGVLGLGLLIWGFYRYATVMKANAQTKSELMNGDLPTFHREDTESADSVEVLDDCDVEMITDGSDREDEE